ncbi:MAG: Glu/Leu/Phe/Val dehydrogenase [Candidatus Marinimicrobia bacterium]|nr:Glu/Leu/Phe/Val dehydrogenase [Candidatus Neomarinimicrobiota bacterium]
MELFSELNERGHEQVSFFHDSHSGLKGLVAIHNTVLGPALGGCRMWHYKNETEALVDVLRLSKGMTYKAAIAGLNLGGGKAVIIGNSKSDKTESLFRSFGRFVEGLGGRYITAEDVGTSIRDMEHVRMETDYVTGISQALGGSGDPSPVTAYGVFTGIKACVMEHLNSTSLDGLKVSIQGLGHVGMYLCENLHKEGAELFVTDIDQTLMGQAVENFGATPVEPESIYDLDVDVYAPCALGATVNPDTVDKFKCSIIAGAANNQLIENDFGVELKKRNILYAPDYAINAGGLINVSNELEGYNRERAFSQAEGIYDTLMEIFRRSNKEDISTNKASDLQAEDRIRKIGELKSFYLPYKKSFKIRNA